MRINKASAEWLIIKAELNTLIDRARAAMEAGVSLEEYHYLRGQIAVAKEIIEGVEPTRPPVTTEDNYGISDPTE